jgi:hypothetical protein
MSDVAETKPDPAIAAPEETKPEATTGEDEKSTTEAVAETATETAEKAAETAKDAAVKTSDSMFSMFGGGPKKEKKEEEEPTDEPSGSAKAQKADEEVSWTHLMLVIWVVVVGRVHTMGAGSLPLSPDSGVAATKPHYARIYDGFIFRCMLIMIS